MGKYKGFSGAGMNTSKNVSSVVRRAQQMQEEMEKVQAEIEAKTVTATAGGGMGNPPGSYNRRGKRRDKAGRGNDGRGNGRDYGRLEYSGVILILCTLHKSKG